MNVAHISVEGWCTIDLPREAAAISTNQSRWRSWFEQPTTGNHARWWDGEAGEEERNRSGGSEEERCVSYQRAHGHQAPDFRLYCSEGEAHGSICRSLLPMQEWRLKTLPRLRRLDKEPSAVSLELSYLISCLLFLICQSACACT